MSVSVEPNTVTKMLWPSKATELPVTRSGQLLCIHTEPAECKVTCCALHPHAEGKFVFGTTLGKVYAVDLITNRLFLLGDANVKAKESLYGSVDSNTIAIYSLAFVGEHRNNYIDKVVEPHFVLALLSNMQIMCIDWNTGRELWPRISCNAHNKQVTKLVPIVPQDFVAEKGNSKSNNNSNSNTNTLENVTNTKYSTPSRVQFVCCSSDMISLWQYCQTAEQARWRCTRLVQPVQLINASLKSQIMKGKVSKAQVEDNVMSNSKEDHKRKINNNSKTINCNVDKGNVHDVQLEMPRFVNAHLTSRYIIALENNGIISKWITSSTTDTHNEEEQSRNKKKKNNLQEDFSQVDEHVLSTKLNTKNGNAISRIKNSQSRFSRSKRSTVPDQCVCTLPFQAACSVINETTLVLGARNSSSIALMTIDHLQGMRKVNLHVSNDAHVVALTQKNGVEQLSLIGNKWVACQLNTHIDSVIVVSLETYAVVFSVTLPHFVSHVGSSSLSRMTLPWCLSTAGCTYALCALPLFHSSSSFYSSISSVESNNLYVYHLPTAKMAYDDNVLATAQHTEMEYNYLECDEDDDDDGNENEKQQSNELAISETHINSTNDNKDKNRKNFDARTAKRSTLHSITPTCVSRYVRCPLDIKEIDLAKWVNVDALYNCDRNAHHVMFVDNTTNHGKDVREQYKYERKANKTEKNTSEEDPYSQHQREEEYEEEFNKNEKKKSNHKNYYYGHATKSGIMVRPRRSSLKPGKQDKQEVQAWEKLMEEIAAFTLDSNNNNNSRNNVNSTSRFTRSDVHNNTRGSNKDLYMQYVGKLRDYLKVYGSFPPTHRPVIWRLLLELPPKSCTLTQFAALDRHDEHICVHGLLQPFPLPRRSKERQSLARVLSILAWHNDVLGMASFMPALVYPFVQIFQNDIQSCVEVVLSFCNNWGQDFFSFYPRYPVRLFVFLERVLRMFDAELHAHLQAIGASAEIWGSLMIFSLYTEILTTSTWLQVMDHAWSMNPMWLFMFHLCYLISLRDKLLQCRNGNEVAHKLSVVQSSVSIAHVIVHAHDMYTQCASQYEFSSPMRPYFTFRNFGPQAIYPNLFRCNMSVLNAKRDEWRALRTHWNETRHAALRLQQLSKHAEDVALESELLYEQESARISAKYEAQSQTWHTKMSIEAARTAYEEAITALQLASIDERTRNAEKLQSLVDHEGQSYLLREMDERTHTQAAAEAKWRNASHAAESELHKMESEAVLRVRALLQKLHHCNDDNNTYLDDLNNRGIGISNMNYISNDDKNGAFANEGMVHSYMMYNETDDDIYTDDDDDENENENDYKIDEDNEIANEGEVAELSEPERFHTRYSNKNVNVQQDEQVQSKLNEWKQGEEQYSESESELLEVDHSVEMLENTDIDVTLIDVGNDEEEEEEEEEGNVVDVEQESLKQKEIKSNNSRVQHEVAKQNMHSEHVLENGKKQTEATEYAYSTHIVSGQYNGNGGGNITQQDHIGQRSPVKNIEVSHLPEIDLLPLPVMPTSVNDNANKTNQLNTHPEGESNNTKVAIPKLYDNLLDNTQKSNRMDRNTGYSASHYEWRTQQTTSLTNEEKQPTTSSLLLGHIDNKYITDTNVQSKEPHTVKEQVIQTPPRLVKTKASLDSQLSSSFLSSACLSSPSTVHANSSALTTQPTSNTTRHTINNATSSHLTTTATATTDSTTITSTTTLSSSPSTTRYNSSYNSSSLSSSPSSSCSITESSNTIFTNELNGAASLQTTANELLHKMQDIIARRRQNLMSNRYRETATAATTTKDQNFTK